MRFVSDPLISISEAGYLKEQKRHFEGEVNHLLQFAQMNWLHEFLQAGFYTSAIEPTFDYLFTGKKCK